MGVGRLRAPHMPAVTPTVDLEFSALSNPDTGGQSQPPFLNQVQDRL